MRKDHNILELSCQKKYETEKAILVLNLKDKEVWIPKSQIEVDHETGDVVDIQIPEWLAIEKELI